MKDARRTGLGFIALGLMLMTCAAQTARSADGTWTGADDTLWTNEINWGAATYPGSVAGDSAMFDGVGGMVDIAGLSGIRNVAFTGAAAFTLGSGGANAQTLVLEDGGALSLAENAVYGPRFDAALHLGATNTMGAYTIRNDSLSQTLAFAGNVSGRPAGGSAATNTLTVSGAGAVAFSGTLDRGSARALDLIHDGAGRLFIAGGSTLRTLYLDGGGTVELGIGELFLNNNGLIVLKATQDTVIDGAGTLRLSTANTAAQPTSFDYANVQVSSGKTLVVNTPIAGTGGIEINSLTGTTILTADNTYEASTCFTAAGTISVGKVGNIGALDSNLGQGRYIRSNSGSGSPRLLYTGTGETTDRIVRMERSITLEHAGSGALEFAADFDIQGNTKTLTLQGDTDGVGVLSGAIPAGASGSLALSKRGAGTWTLAGANAYTGQTTIASGRLIATHPRALAGTDRVLFQGNAEQTALLELAHDGVNEAPFDATVGVGYTGTILSGNAAGNNTGITHAVGFLDLSSITLNIARAESIENGLPCVSAAALSLTSGSSGTTTLNPTTADMLITGGVSIQKNSAAKTLRLAGTSIGSRVDCVISNGINRLALIKADTGIWTLSGANSYTGSTSVTEGTLILSGASGALLGTSDITLSGGTLLLDNAAAVSADRMGDAVPVILAGGTLAFAHNAAATDYSETLGALTVSVSVSTVSAARAAVGQTSTLTFASLAHEGGIVNFTGEGLGADGRNRILFATPPALTGGIIGPWATVNGTHLATYGANGIEPYIPPADSETEIAARGPGSVIPNNSTAHVRITNDGTAGTIALGADDTSVASITQTNQTIAAVVATANQTLRAATLAIIPDSAALTIGDAPADGTLTPSAAGGTLSLENHSAAALTVNAAIADNGSASSLVQFGTGAVTLNGPVSHTGPTFIHGGALTLGGHDVPQTVSSVIGGTGALVKDGTNLLHLIGANIYTGPTIIRQGILRVDQNTALGSTQGGTIIESGATFDLACSSDVGGTRPSNGLNMQGEPISVGGTGAEGMGGALVNSSPVSQYNALGKVTLTDNTVFGGPGRWDIRNGTLDMNGHGVTKTGTNTFSLSDVIVTTGGDGASFDVAEGAMRIQTTTRFNGSAANTLTVRGGASFEFYRVAEPQPWTMVLEDGSTILPIDGNSRWTGPVTLNGAATLNHSSGSLDIQGPVSGIGSATKNGGGTITLSGTENTYTGTTSVVRGRLVFASLRNVGEPSSFGQPATAEAGTIKIGNGTQAVALECVGEGGTSDRVIDLSGTTGAVNLYHNGTGPLRLTSDFSRSGSGNKTLTLYGNSSFPAEIAGSLGAPSSGTILLEKREGGDWILSGNNASSGSARTYEGTLAFTGSNAWSGAVTLYGKRITLAGTGGGFTGGYFLNGGELVISGTNAQASGEARIGSLANSNGVMRVLPGALYTATGGNFCVGYGENSAGALYVSGGTLARTPTDGSLNFSFGGYADGCYGYLHVSGGAVTNTRIQIGGRDAALAQGIGVVRLTGGTLTIPRWVLLGRNTGSTGILTMEGDARFEHGGSGDNFVLGMNGGRSELNMLGGVLNNSLRTVSVRQGSLDTGGAATSSVNLCAGTLIANRINLADPGSSVYVNFRGGTFSVSAAGTPLDNALTAVTLFGGAGSFAGGAVIDTDGKAVTVSAPLLSPIGDGVAAVALADGGSGYIGEPVVTIAPPPEGGVPATAVATMADDGAGNGTYRVAAIVVTCPGSGYVESPTVTFEGGGTLAVSAVAGAVTLAPDAGGGLTKDGEGTLTLSAANTYAGPTVVKAGTLKLGHAQAFPSGTDIVLAGGTLDLNGQTVTASGVSGSGTLVNGAVQTVLSPGGAGVVATDTLTLTDATLTGGTYLADVTEDGKSDLVTIHGNIDLSGWTVTVIDPAQLNSRHAYTLLTCDGTVTGLPTINLEEKRWRIAHRQTDGAIRLLFTNGTLFTVK